MKKSIKKVHQFGGGVICGVFKDYIAITFDDGTTEHIENNGVDSIKKQVNNFIKNEKENSKAAKTISSRDNKRETE